MVQRTFFLAAGNATDNLFPQHTSPEKALTYGAEISTRQAPDGFTLSADFGNGGRMQYRAGGAVLPHQPAAHVGIVVIHDAAGYMTIVYQPVITSGQRTCNRAVVGDGDIAKEQVMHLPAFPDYAEQSVKCIPCAGPTQSGNAVIVPKEPTCKRRFRFPNGRKHIVAGKLQVAAKTVPAVQRKLRVVSNAHQRFGSANLPGEHCRQLPIFPYVFRKERILKAKVGTLQHPPRKAIPVGRHRRNRQSASPGRYLLRHFPLQQSARRSIRFANNRKIRNGESYFIYSGGINRRQRMEYRLPCQPVTGGREKKGLPVIRAHPLFPASIGQIKRYVRIGRKVCFHGKGDR
ncbi:MAG: hypothetical protein BWY09_01021 [Candidatus Hydrogenedentes bacterium ADurb.Bin179]|nr:MAG: hypothetical protein BWY09_01021 [Candidatus Hydrogenedentes bacterium ADurb.Bin179]